MPTSIAGRRVKKLGPKRLAGMTLIELMVGMAIIGVILSVAVAGIRNLTDAEMKATASRLASTIRYLYNKAATERLTLRVVYDFDNQSYRVESTTDPFVIAPPVPEEVGAQVRPEVAEGEQEPAAAGGFSEEETSLLKEVRFSGDVFLKDVQVSYSKEKIESGQAYTYFFPNGFATPTIVNLRDDDDETHYSLTVMPMSGRVRIESEYRELQATE